MGDRTWKVLIDNTSGLLDGRNTGRYHSDHIQNQGRNGLYRKRPGASYTDRWAIRR